MKEVVGSEDDGVKSVNMRVQWGQPCVGVLPGFSDSTEGVRHDLTQDLLRFVCGDEGGRATGARVEASSGDVVQNRASLFVVESAIQELMPSLAAPVTPVPVPTGGLSGSGGVIGVSAAMV